MGDHLALDFPADEIPADAFLALDFPADEIPADASLAPAVPVPVRAVPAYAGSYSSAANASRLNRYAILEVLGDMEFPNSDASFSRDRDSDNPTSSDPSQIAGKFLCNSQAGPSSSYQQALVKFNVDTVDPVEEPIPIHDGPIVQMVMVLEDPVQEGDPAPHHDDEEDDEDVNEEDEQEPVEGDPAPHHDAEEDDDDEAVHEEEQEPVEGDPAPHHDGAEDDGFTLVVSQKFGMMRGLYPEAPYMPPPEKVCGKEFPWLPMVGTPREVKKWAQARKGVYLGTPGGEACFTFGTFGPSSLER